MKKVRAGRNITGLGQQKVVVHFFSVSDRTEDRTVTVFASICGRRTGGNVTHQGFGVSSSEGSEEK